MDEDKFTNNKKVKFVFQIDLGYTKGKWVIPHTFILKEENLLKVPFKLSIERLIIQRVFEKALPTYPTEFKILGNFFNMCELWMRKFLVPFLKMDFFGSKI